MTLTNLDLTTLELEAASRSLLKAGVAPNLDENDWACERLGLHEACHTIREAPAVEVYLVKSAEAPGGIGEPGTTALAPALTNAIFAATGKRIRKLPVNRVELHSA